MKTPFRDRVRTLARRCLPEPLRKPLGTLSGKFDERVVQPIQGFIFDLSGGHFRTDGCTFVIPKDQTSRSYRACFLSDIYESEERSLVKKFIQPDDSVIELGGCLGIVSCTTNKLLADKTRHVVVEGNPFCISTLHQNRNLNKCGFVIENCAITNEPTATFYLHPRFIVGGTTQRETARPVRVPGRSLAELEARYGPFTVLIIDIEGAELEVFERSREVLSHYRLVVAELHDWALGEKGVERCRELLAQAGLHFQGRAGITEAWQRM
jgi:FkbM family methyltransferase